MQEYLDWGRISILGNPGRLMPWLLMMASISLGGCLLVGVVWCGTLQTAGTNAGGEVFCLIRVGLVVGQLQVENRNTKLLFCAAVSGKPHAISK